jgi:hypothetical protein
LVFSHDSRFEGNTQKGSRQQQQAQKESSDMRRTFLSLSLSCVMLVCVAFHTHADKFYQEKAGAAPSPFCFSLLFVMQVDWDCTSPGTDTPRVSLSLL